MSNISTHRGFCGIMGQTCLKRRNIYFFFLLKVKSYLRKQLSVCPNFYYVFVRPFVRPFIPLFVRPSCFFLWPFVMLSTLTKKSMRSMLFLQYYTKLEKTLDQSYNSECQTVFSCKSVKHNKSMRDDFPSALGFPEVSSRSISEFTVHCSGVSNPGRRPILQVLLAFLMLFWKKK